MRHELHQMLEQIRSRGITTKLDLEVCEPLRNKEALIPGLVFRFRKMPGLFLSTFDAFGKDCYNSEGCFYLVAFYGTGSYAVSKVSQELLTDVENNIIFNYINNTLQ